MEVRQGVGGEEEEMITINGKQYPMWSQFIERKDEWIGGILQEMEDSWPQITDGPSKGTKITDITLEPNGEDSAYFSVEGEVRDIFHFSFSRLVRYLLLFLTSLFV